MLGFRQPFPDDCPRQDCLKPWLTDNTRSLKHSKTTFTYTVTCRYPYYLAGTTISILDACISHYAFRATARSLDTIGSGTIETYQ